MQLDLFTAPSRRPGPDLRAMILADICQASARTVADRYGVTRNAVLGIVYRSRQCGIEVRTHCRPARPAADVAPIRPRPVVPAPTLRRAVVATPAPIVREVVAPVVAMPTIPRTAPVALLDIGPRQCRAIDGDPAEALCCGSPVDGRGSWCARHRDLFRSPAKMRPVRISTRDM